MKNYQKEIKSGIFFIRFIFFVALIYFALCTGFTFAFTEYKGYYGALADAFMRFQTHLEIKPEPELLKLNDPYDPKLNAPYKLWDASLFHERYYLYWGPVPALVRILFLNQLPEQSFIYLYTLGSTIAALLIIWTLEKYTTKKYNYFLLYTSFLMIAFNGAVLSLIGANGTVYSGAGGIYYEAIASSQMFFLTGLYFTTLFLINKNYKILFCSMIFLALAFGSRIIFFLPSVVISFLLIVYEVIRFKKEYKKISLEIIKIVLASTPIIVMAILLALYNYERFGSFTEFGVNYQLSGLNMPIDAKWLHNIHNIPTNLRNYLLNIPDFSYKLPFIGLNQIHYSHIERIVFSIFILSPVTIFLFFLRPTVIILKKIYAILITATMLILLQLCYLLPDSVTRYIFDYIYVFNISAVILLVTNIKTKIDLNIRNIFAMIICIITIFIGISMYLFSKREYQSQMYFETNMLTYRITGVTNFFDPIYKDTEQIKNKMGTYLYISDLHTDNGIEKDKEGMFILLGNTPITFTIYSFSKKPINSILSYNVEMSHSGNHEKMVIQVTTNAEIKKTKITGQKKINIPITIKPGVNYISFDIKFDPNKRVIIEGDTRIMLVKLSNLQILKK